MMQDMRANGLTTEDIKDCAKWSGLSLKADPGKHREKEEDL